jgi:SAM-dependent methyltransferase
MSISRLVLLDASAAMLRHSAHWLKEDAHAILGDAALLPLRSCSLQLLVASLGDPFNSQAFWLEASRVLEPGGRLIFTTPSYQWAERFRSTMKQDQQKAEFDLADKRRVYTPSFIYQEEKQASMIEAVGLTLKQVDRFPLAALRSNRISWKLREPLTAGDSVALAYLAVKAN